jgi:Flp pilus assembly protein TadG
MNAPRPIAACHAVCAPRPNRRIASRRRWGSSPRFRTGAAVVELAILAPLMVFLFVIAVDFARVYYFSLTLTNCARSGAFYASDPWTQVESPFTSTTDAALSEARNLSPPPTISEKSGADGSGHAWVEVTAEHTFTTITGFPGVPNEVRLSRSVKMYVSAIVPTN